MKIHSVRKQFLITLFLSGAAASLVYAQQAARPKPAAPAATKPASPAKPATEGPGKVVLKVGSQNFTQADMDFLVESLSPQIQQAVAQQGRKPLGEQYAVMALLSQLAEKDHLEASPEFRRQMALHRLQSLAQAEYGKLAKDIKVSPEEISQYYSAHASEFDQAQVREFLILKQPEGAKEGTPGLSAQEAKLRADQIRKALADGTDPKKVAEKFSVPNTVKIDAEPRTLRHGQLVAVLEKAAFELKDGEISEPLDTPQALAFLQVAGHSRPALKDVSEDIENTLHQQKVQTAVEELKSKTTIWMDEEYFKGPAKATESSAPPPKQ